MKTAITFIFGFFFMILLLLQLSAQGGWEWQNPLPQGIGLTSIFFADINTGYAAGRFGTIVKTTDGGASCTAQLSRILNDLTSAYYSETNHGCAVGYSATICRYSIPSIK
jgi:hypothetical protein